MVTSVMEVRDAARRANELLRDIAAARRTHMRKQARLDERIQKLKDGYGPEIESLKQEEKRLVDELIELVVPRFMLLAVKGTKTIKLRSGEISLRTGKEVLEVTDPAGEDAVIQRIARRGGLRRFTRVGKRTLNKDALKKHPDFVARVPGLEIVRRTSVVIRPSRAQGEIVRTTDALSVQIKEEGD